MSRSADIWHHCIALYSGEHVFRVSASGALNSSCSMGTTADSSMHALQFWIVHSLAYLQHSGKQGYLHLRAALGKASLQQIPHKGVQIVRAAHHACIGRRAGHLNTALKTCGVPRVIWTAKSSTRAAA